MNNHFILFITLFAELESLRGRIVVQDKELEELKRSTVVKSDVD